MEYVSSLLFAQRDNDIDTDGLIDKLYKQLVAELGGESVAEIKEMAARFIQSELADEIMAADSVQTEIQFQSGEMYHGIIDLLIETDKEVIGECYYLFWGERGNG